MLVEIEGYTGTEVAELLGVPESTVRTRMFHARRKLRTHLSAESVR
ncbi:MAG TPA: sigma factor-like helix-turn-helix DNA-binding protein [Polyangiaceae bacterium]|nr:sigma factor-like helix-turn-helix DNA-binding protein [Polyangiaceae bacterium]